MAKSWIRLGATSLILVLLSLQDALGSRASAVRAAKSRSTQNPLRSASATQHQLQAKNLLQTGDEWDEDGFKNLDNSKLTSGDANEKPKVQLVGKETKDSEALNKLTAKLDKTSEETGTSNANLTNSSKGKNVSAVSTQMDEEEDEDPLPKTTVKLEGKGNKQSEALNKLNAQLDQESQYENQDADGELDYEQLAELEEEALDEQSLEDKMVKGQKSTKSSKSSDDFNAWQTAEDSAANFEDYEDEDADEESTPQVVSQESFSGGDEFDEELDFENLMKEEAHQEALNTGENPAALAHGSRNSSINGTSNYILDKAKKNQTGDAKRKEEKEKFTSGYEDLQDFDVDPKELEEEELEDNDESQTLTLPDDSIQRAINAHMVDPMPGNKSQASNSSVATAHEKDTLGTIKDLQDVVAEEDLDDSLASEKESEVERLIDHAEAAQNVSALKVDKSTQQLQHLIGQEESSKVSNNSLGSSSEKSASVITQGVIMGGQLKDAVQTSSTTAKIVAIIIAALAGVGVAWGSIVLYNRFRPANSGALPKVIEIGGYGRKSPSYSKVKTRGDEQNGSSWQDWDDDWDDQAANIASSRRGSSVKQKRQQKWDDDW